MKGRPYSLELYTEVKAAHAENREIRLSRACSKELGHTKRPLTKVIRSMCLDCSGGSPSQVRLCTSPGCPLWPYRLGTNPYHKRK